MAASNTTESPLSTAVNLELVAVHEVREDAVMWMEHGSRGKSEEKVKKNIAHHMDLVTLIHPHIWLSDNMVHQTPFIARCMIASTLF